jgi:hypothetical protein
MTSLSRLIKDRLAGLASTLHPGSALLNIPSVVPLCHPGALRDLVPVWAKLGTKLGNMGDYSPSVYP